MKGLKIAGTVVAGVFVVGLILIMIFSNIDFSKSNGEYADYESGNIEDLPDNIVDENLEQEAGLNAGEMAPDFELTTLEGEQVKLSDYKGKKVILNFWASWCPPCKKEMPYMETYYQEHAQDENVEILAVNMTTLERGKPENAPKFVEEHRLTFPVLMDEAGVVKDRYEVMIYPTTYMINEDGMITARTNALLEVPYLKQLVKESDDMVKTKPNENTSRNPALDKGLGVGNEAPDFTLTSTTGKTVKLSDYKGKMLFVNFWTTWCPTCSDELEQLQQYADEQADEKEVAILSVNLTGLERGSEDEIDAFLEKYSLTIPTLLDSSGEVEELYRIDQYPTTYVINGEGNIVDIVNIPLDQNLIDWLVENGKDFDVDKVE